MWEPPSLASRPSSLWNGLTWRQLQAQCLIGGQRFRQGMLRVVKSAERKPLAAVVCSHPPRWRWTARCTCLRPGRRRQSQTELGREVLEGQLLLAMRRRRHRLLLQRLAVSDARVGWE